MYIWPTEAVLCFLWMTKTEPTKLCCAKSTNSRRINIRHDQPNYIVGLLMESQLHNSYYKKLLYVSCKKFFSTSNFSIFSGSSAVISELRCCFCNTNPTAQKSAEITAKQTHVRDNPPYSLHHFWVMFLERLEKTKTHQKYLMVWS